MAAQTDQSVDGQVDDSQMGEMRAVHGRENGLAAAPCAAVQAPHLATAQAPSAASGLAAASCAAVQAPQSATLAPEEMFGQILTGQGEVTATVDVFKAS
eukprot:5998707-Pyramimonas_sp.AAC.1